MSVRKHIQTRQLLTAVKNAATAVRLSGKEGYALKNVRIWFKKYKAAKYISHLDLNRVMTRALQHSRLPVWHTEGFNPHPFITFALPLIKLTDEVPYEDIISRLNKSLPDGIEIYNVTEPVMKAGKIAFGHFDMKMSCDSVSPENLFMMMREMFAQEKIEVEKSSKKGTPKILDLKPDIGSYTLEKMSDYVQLDIILPAGSVNNINPVLLINALEKINNISVDYDITRLDVYNEEMKPFE